MPSQHERKLDHYHELYEVTSPDGEVLVVDVCENAIQRWPEEWQLFKAGCRSMRILTRTHHSVAQYNPLSQQHEEQNELRDILKDFMEARDHAVQVIKSLNSGRVVHFPVPWDEKKNAA